MPRSDQLKTKQNKQLDFAVLKLTRAISNLPVIDTNDAEAVRLRIEEYFDLCEMYLVKPTMANLCLALHVSRGTLNRWIAGAVNKPIEVLDIVQQAVATINGLMESYMMEGLANPLSTMFLMKNNHGYKDTSEQVVVKAEIAGNVDIKKLEQKYMSAIPEVIDADFTEVEKDKEDGSAQS